MFCQLFKSVSFLILYTLWTFLHVQWQSGNVKASIRHSRHFITSKAAVCGIPESNDRGKMTDGRKSEEAVEKT